jgi:site-specific recombinase XerD
MSILDEEIKKNIMDYDLLMCTLECYLDNAPKDMGVDLKIKDAIIYLLQFYAYCLKNNETEQLKNIKIVINKICANEYLKKNLEGISELSGFSGFLALNTHNNLKHKTMLSLIYSCGLRCGELLALEPHHIDSKRNIVLFKNSKGKKDRIVPLSSKILEMLRDYYKLHKPSKIFV